MTPSLAKISSSSLGWGAVIVVVPGHLALVLDHQNRPGQTGKL